MTNKRLQLRPLTEETWEDFTSLFGNSGAYCGCWCMYWRLTRRELEVNGNSGNRAAMRELVDQGVVPGILAYEDEIPVGWCAVAPRSDLPSLNRSPVLKRVDEEPVWAITCFFATKSHRNGGIMETLIEGAVEHAMAHGASIIEAYPHAPVDGKTAPVTAYMGFPSPFERLGFRLVRKASKARWIMRYDAEEHA